MYDDASLRYLRSLDMEGLATSVDVGWTSLLLDHRRCATPARELTTQPTPDLNLVVQTQGRQTVEVNKRGTWSRAAYGPGSVAFVKRRLMWYSSTFRMRRSPKRRTP